MSADILFEEGRSWSCLSAGFEELMDRAKAHCGPNDSVIIDIISFAELVGCLGIQSFAESCIRIRLTKAVLAAAVDWLDELEGRAETLNGGAENMRKLVLLATAYLAEQERNEGKPRGEGQ